MWLCFKNNLQDMALGFKRLEALKFCNVGDEDSILLTITRKDGTEERIILPEDSEIVRNLTANDTYS